MATNYKILGQVSPASTSNTTLYTVPSSLSAVISTLMISNTSVSASKCNVFVVPSGSSASQTNAIIYDGTIDGNDFRALTIGITLSEGDSVIVRSETENSLNFHAFGSEVS